MRGTQGERKKLFPAGPSIWERIQSGKQAVVEPRDAALFPQAAEDFKAKLKDSTTGGAVFFAVCRCARGRQQLLTWLHDDGQVKTAFPPVVGEHRGLEMFDLNCP